MTAIAALAPGLSQLKFSLEADALREQVADLTDRLAKARRHLKAEKAYSKRLRRRLDQLTNNETTSPSPEEKNDH